MPDLLGQSRCIPVYQRPAQNIDECSDDPDLCVTEQRPCINQLGSYQCGACFEGWQQVDGLCVDLDECKPADNLCVQRNRFCENFLEGKGYECRACKNDYIESGGVCFKGPSNVVEIVTCNSRQANCARGATCVDLAGGGYTCVCLEPLLGDGTDCECPEGFQKEDDVTCVDTDECKDGTHNCKGPGTCVNTPTSYYCSCPEGYMQPDTESGQAACEDVDECKAYPTLCGTIGTCTNTEGSYTCECPNGYELGSLTLPEPCVDINEADAGQCVCGDHAFCVNTDGGYDCDCEDGYEKDDGGECVDIDECAAEVDCGGGTCSNLDGSYQCDCSSGYDHDLSSDPCVDIDECDAGTDDCGEHSTCSNTAGGFDCLCDEGYEKDGDTCIDIDECDTGDYDCGEAGTCVNVDGTYDCDCEDGYARDNGEGPCVDINECDTTNICGGGTCANNDGSYECTCNTGYTHDTDQDPCADIDECDLGTDDCGAHSTCQNNDGGFDCVCDSGYAKDGASTCTNINECNFSYNCDAHATCFDTDGGYTCWCDNGLTPANGQTPPGTCTDVNECAGSNLCDSNSDCVNIFQGYRCDCKAGFTKGTYIGSDSAFHSLYSCIDIDECQSGTDNCGEHSTCSNNDGGFDCDCDEGYEKDGDACIDTDECDGGAYCGSGTCVNTDGSYRCDCDSGYGHDNEQDSCGDIDECSLGTNDCGPNSTCSNTDGSYFCECDEGYTQDSRHRALLVVGGCVDIDECAAEPAPDCGDGGTCSNLDGTYECVCDSGYDHDLSTDPCTDIDECTVGAWPCDTAPQAGGGYIAICKALAPDVAAGSGFQCSCPASGYSGDGTVVSPCTATGCYPGNAKVWARSSSTAKPQQINIKDLRIGDYVRCMTAPVEENFDYPYDLSWCYVYGWQHANVTRNYGMMKVTFKRADGTNGSHILTVPHFVYLLPNITKTGTRLASLETIKGHLARPRDLKKGDVMAAAVATSNPGEFDGFEAVEVIASVDYNTPETVGWYLPAIDSTYIIVDDVLACNTLLNYGWEGMFPKDTYLDANRYWFSVVANELTATKPLYAPIGTPGTQYDLIRTSIYIDDKNQTMRDIKKLLGKKVSREGYSFNMDTCYWPWFLDVYKAHKAAPTSPGTFVTDAVLAAKMQECLVPPPTPPGSGNDTAGGSVAKH